MKKLSSKQYEQLAEQVGLEKMSQIERASGYTDTPLQKKAEKLKQEQEKNNDIEKKATRVVVSRKKDQEAFESNTENIIRLHISIADMLSQSLVTATEIGRLLFEQKRVIKHGEFSNWVEAHLPFKLRTAQRYMKLHQYKETLNEKGVNSITEAYHYLFDQPISDEIIEVDDSLSDSYVYIKETVNLDKIELPKKRKKGLQHKYKLNNNLIDQILNSNSILPTGREGRYSKIVIELCKHDPTLMRIGELVVAIEKFLMPGGKIIFFKR